MQLFSIPIILRVVEIVVDCIIMGVYYGTNTIFKASAAGDNFGQFVIIGGLVSACIMLGVCMLLDLEKKMPFVVIGYNAVWIIFYFAAGVMILSSWSGSVFKPKSFKGGVTVGSFCLFEVVILILNSVFTFTNKTE